MNVNGLNKVNLYVYFALVVLSMVSDKCFYKGQKSENKREYETTSYYLALTWFVSLIVPALEYAYFNKYNFLLSLTGIVLIVCGVVIRGIGIKTLGEFFSRNVENWDNQKIIKIGIYKYIRHPSYVGNILQVVGFPLVLNSYFSLIFSFITIIGFLWRIKVEEEFLIRKFPDYKGYMRETKKLLPKVW